MTPRALPALILLALAAPGIGQNEAEPFFALSSNRTFGSGGKPTVGLSAFNVQSLEFRVYRINDPVKFFQQLEDAHQFGGSNPAPPRERTWIERIHDWKRGLRAGIRSSLRAQFTESPSQHLESILPRESKPTRTKGAQFAEAPLLNSQQLVTRFRESVAEGDRWETHNVEVPVKDKGIYLVEAVHDDLRAYTILMVSDLVMITKTGRNRIVSFVADRTSGEPVSGVEVFMFARGGNTATATTNSEGLAEVPVPAARPEDFRIVARRSGDTAVSTLASYAFNAAREHWSGFIYTDRPVYRPGHTVNFKGILRLGAGGAWQVPAGRQVNVTINDPEQKAVYQKSLTATATGSIRDTFTVPSGAALGGYSVEVRPAGAEDYMNGSFEVQEYKKPEYEVRVTSAKPRVLQGDTVQAVIDARYYFGEPVANAKVKYSVYRNRYWFPLWYDGDDEDSPPDAAGAGNDQDEGDQLSDVEGKLDADGKLTISFPTKPADNHWDFRYRIEAKVTDEANREISGTGWVTATYGSFLLNVQPERYFYQPGSRGTFQIQARDYDSKPVQTRVKVELGRWNWRDDKKYDVQSSTDVSTGADGNAAAELAIPAGGGSYRVTVTARTPEGRDVSSYTYLWIAGRGEMDYGSDRKTVEIVPDKKRYRPGETAKLLIVTGQPNTPVLVTLEGRDLRSQQIVRSKDSTAEFDVPVTAEDEPGLWVSASFVRKGELYQGTKRVKVPPEEHKLNVKLSTDKPQYQPGQAAAYTLDVTDSAGRPVPRAEFSVGVVDEAIYAIRPDTTQEIVDFFFGHSWNVVFTSTSFEYYFSGDAGKRRMRLASLRPPSQLAQLKPERLVRPKVRKVFPDTAFWAPEVTTDSNGHAVAKVTYPDTLTTWRATARGATTDTRVGAAVLKTIVRKNLILRLAVPRFFIQGDEVVIPAIVHNYLATDKMARVSLKLEGLDVLSGAAQEIKVPSRGEVKVEWRVKARQVLSARLYGEALTDEESDALQLDLPVNPPGVKLGVSKGGSIGGSAETSFALTYPPQVEPGSRALTLRVSPSIAGSLFGALEYLTAFPYGCVEQTMSSFLPNIIVQEAIRDLKLKSSVDPAALNEKIRAGLDRLYGFQHEDGGWGWWQTDESHSFMTAYVVAGLVQAKAAGTAVNDEAVQRGAKWLFEHNDSKYLPDMRAYIYYSLSLAGHKPKAEPQLDRLSPYGLAILGQVSDQKAGIAAMLEKQVQQNDTEAWWPATRDEMLDFSADVTPEATAYAVKFLASQNPNNPLLPKAAVWLMNHRSEGYWWSSTKQTAMVIYGLIDYLKASKELNPNLTATVYVNDQPVLTKQFTNATAIDSPEIKLDESKLKPGENRIRLTTSGEGRLYYSARAGYYSTEEKLQKVGKVQLNILRDYFRLVPGKDGDKIVYDLAPLEGPVTIGDTIAVRLTVTGGEWKYLLIEDPIPAGTEFIEKDNLYELKTRPPWWRWTFTRRELHDDRMAIFQTYFSQGQDQHFYLLKVVNPGQFRVSPARVQPMYQPEFLSTTESRRLEVK